MRMSHGGIYHWELEKGGQKLQMGLPVRFAFNELLAIKQAVLLGLGIGFISEWFIEEELKAGALVPVLVPWCPSFGGLRLYYSGHRFAPARLRALIDLVHELRLAGAPLRGARTLADKIGEQGAFRDAGDLRDLTGECACPLPGYHLDGGRKDCVPFIFASRTSHPCQSPCKGQLSWGCGGERPRPTKACVRYSLDVPR